MKTVSENKSNTLIHGKIISVRGSVVDVWFENHLPSINTLLYAGIENKVAIEVLAQLDAKSVSRVGGKAQLPAYRTVTGNLKLAYAQFEELESFARFGTRLDENTRQIIEHGKRIRTCLKQPEFEPISVPEQIIVLLALTAALFDNVPLNKMHEAEIALYKSTSKFSPEIMKRLFSDKLSDEDRDSILKIASDTLASFQPAPDSKQENK